MPEILEGLPIVRPTKTKKVYGSGRVNKKLAVKPISSNLLNYRQKVFSAPASVLRGHELATKIAVKSERTGKEVVFELVQVLRDRAGEATELVWQADDLQVRVRNDGVW